MTDRSSLNDLKRDLERVRKKVTGEGESLAPIDTVDRVNEASVAIALSEESADEIRAAVAALEREGPKQGYVLEGKQAAAVGECPAWWGEFRPATDRAKGGNTLEFVLRTTRMTAVQRAAIEGLTGGPDVPPDDWGRDGGVSQERQCSLSPATSKRVLQCLPAALSPIDDRPWYLAFSLEGADGPPQMTATPLPPAHSKEGGAARKKHIKKRFEAGLPD